MWPLEDLMDLGDIAQLAMLMTTTHLRSSPLA